MIDAPDRQGRGERRRERRDDGTDAVMLSGETERRQLPGGGGAGDGGVALAAEPAPVCLDPGAAGRVLAREAPPVMQAAVLLADTIRRPRPGGADRVRRPPPAPRPHKTEPRTGRSSRSPTRSGVAGPAHHGMGRLPDDDAGRGVGRRADRRGARRARASSPALPTRRARRAHGRATTGTPGATNLIMVREMS